MMARALAVALVVTCATSAHAEDKQKAKIAFRAALQHYNLGEFRAALDGFKEAYRNYEDPTFLFNLGQCERQLGEKQEAVNFYKAYLRELPDAPNRAEVRELVVKLEAQLQVEATTRQEPPTGALTPGQPATHEAELTAAPPPPAPAPTPVYKRWWFWTAVGGVAAVGLGVGLGVGLSSGGSTPTATTSEGTFHPF